MNFCMYGISKIYFSGLRLFWSFVNKPITISFSYLEYLFEIGATSSDVIFIAKLKMLLAWKGY
jgi:hypothetical protein